MKWPLALGLVGVVIIAVLMVERRFQSDATTIARVRAAADSEAALAAQWRGERDSALMQVARVHTVIRLRVDTLRLLLPDSLKPALDSITTGYEVQITVLKTLLNDQARHMDFLSTRYNAHLADVTAALYRAEHPSAMRRLTVGLPWLAGGLLLGKVLK